MESDALHLTDE